MSGLEPTMPSPFPGMDPYLEGYLWTDVHNALASKIRQLLVPLLRPRYTARLEVYEQIPSPPALSEAELAWVQTILPRLNRARTEIPWDAERMKNAGLVLC